MEGEREREGKRGRERGERKRDGKIRSRDQSIGRSRMFQSRTNKNSPVKFSN